MTDCKQPLTVDSADLCDVILYQKIIESPIYLAITRPDLSYMVELLSQFMQSPLTPHLDYAKQALHYVKGMLDSGILYGYKEQIKLRGFTNVDWAGNASHRRSTSGFLFSLGKQGNFQE